MFIKYKIGTQEHRVTFCPDKEEPTIAKDLSRLYSDKKILLIIDKKIDQDVIQNLIKDLKNSTSTLDILIEILNLVFKEAAVLQATL